MVYKSTPCISVTSHTGGGHQQNRLHDKAQIFEELTCCRGRYRAARSSHRVPSAPSWFRTDWDPTSKARPSIPETRTETVFDMANLFRPSKLALARVQGRARRYKSGDQKR